MENNYVQILVESLQKKTHILSQIIDKSQKQYDIFQSEPVDLDGFEKYTMQKTDLIQKLDELDIGFEILYKRVKQMLNANKSVYAKEILQMQQLITVITDQSVKIQRMEMKNKTTIEAYFSHARKRLRASQKITTAANSYHKNMNRVNRVDPQLLDTKK